MPDISRPGSSLDRLVALGGRPGVLVAAGVVLAVATLHLWVTPSNPPGFLHDEASMAYNAHTLGTTLRDENGGLLPLYVRSFGDYKSPLFAYVLAATFRVTGASSEAARAVAAVAVLAGVLLLGLLAYRRTRSGLVALALVVLAGLTPGLYEVGRAAYEVALQPLLLCLLLLALDRAQRSGWTIGVGVAVGLALVALAYAYAAGRVLAPLFAVALLVFAGRARLRGLVAAWLTVGAGLLPIAVYWIRHPGALSERYDQTTFVDSSMSLWTIVSRAAANYVGDVNPWLWGVSGDTKPYVHTYGAGTLFLAGLLLAGAGVALVLLRQRSDLWWRYVLVITVLSPVPAALTRDRNYGLRLVPFFVLLLVLTIPALDTLLRAARTRWAARAALALLAAGVGLQFADFLDNYRTVGPARGAVFNAGVPGLLREGFGGDRTLYVDHDESHALTYARWYAVEHGLPLSRVVRLPDGGVPPDGSIVVRRFLGCDFPCVEIARSGDYSLARAEIPPPADATP